MGDLMWFAVLIVVPMLLGLYAQWKVKSAFRASMLVRASSGLTGAEVAREICKAHGIKDVGVEVSHGMLSDHYDPSAKMLRLSEDVYNGTSVGSLGIAAHEAGHALQHATGYGPLRLRSGIVPLAMIGSHVSNFAILGGCLAMALIGPKLGAPLLLLGIAGLTLVAVFQLITLPVEFDASRRAKDLLTSTGLVAPGEETRAMSRVLNAAALTYVAALVATVGTIIYYLFMLLGNQRSEE
jgi:uncharacterized protein